jgi:hypothetical protein
MFADDEYVKDQHLRLQSADGFFSVADLVSRPLPLRISQRSVVCLSFRYLFVDRFEFPRY